MNAILHDRRRCVPLAVCSLLACTLLAGASRASAEDATADSSQKPGTQWALLIGCEKYLRANPLRFTVNDVHQVGATLRSRGGMDREHILEMTDKSTNEKLRPLKANLTAELATWLKKLGPKDTLIVYFSGHGFRDTDGRMYLAPLDIDPDNPAATGISIEWLREQIAGCAADFKLLLIDACHAGSEKGNDDKSAVAASDLGKKFEELEKVVTLASSRADQVSQIWEDKSQSLFSYWLNQGLKGHADANGDGEVDIDELFKYVERLVSTTAQKHFPRVQKPVRIVRSGTDGVPVVVRLKPQPLKQVLADMAEQLADAVADRQFSKVGVVEFTNITPGGDEVLGSNFGLLGAYCAEDMERRLTDLGTGRFSVISRQRLKEALADGNFGVQDLESSQALKALGDRADGMPVLAHGVLRGRAGSLINLQCKVVETNGDETIASVGGTAFISESEWAMLGRSAAVRPDDRIPEPPGSSSTSAEEQVIQHLDEQAQQQHPQNDPKFPFRVYLMVDGKERKGEVKGNDYIVKLRKGEVFQIWIDDRRADRQPAMLRLLVDGLNTLPEKLDTKGVTTVEWGKRVSLEEARTWELHPNQEQYAIAGFVTRVDNNGHADLNGEMVEFKLVDANEGLAARQKFTEQIGIITAAFYDVAGGPRRIAIGPGDKRRTRFDASEGYKVGNLLGVVHIHYVEGE
ncbi:MAG: caspase domain-containing protein [Pirellulales bacterium]